jgi:ribonuclease VapC
VIAVDSSALMAILLEEDWADECREALVRDTEPLISAATLAEVYIVSRGRNVLTELEMLLTSIPIDVIPADGETAARVSAIHARWGRKRHPAELNIVDCFSYDVAREHDCPLLFVGNDFARTDVRRALAL